MSSKKKADEEKKLDEADIRKLEHSFFRCQLEIVNIDKARLSVNKAGVELTLLSAQYTLKSKEIVELKAKLKNLEKESKELTELHSEIKDQIKNKHGLSSDWGFDPETGVIK